MKEDFLYTKEHVWIKKFENKAWLGLTEYFNSEVGDILLVELLEAGRYIEKGDNFTTIETAKAILDIKSPISGKIKEINLVLGDNPELIKDDPYGDGWIVVLEVRPDEPLDDLMNFREYEKYINENGIK